METAIVNGRDLSISKKHAVEICSFIRGKSVERSKQLLQQVIEKKIALPFRRFNRDMGHRRGAMAAGRYPFKASKVILQLLGSLEANAQNKGLDTKSLYITHIVANKAPTPWHYGRLRRRKMKRAHVTIVAGEKAVKKQEPKEKPEKQQ